MSVSTISSIHERLYKDYIPYPQTPIQLARVEWYYTTAPYASGHGSWIPYKQAKEVVDYYTVHCPTMVHKLVLYQHQ